jgi:hypothetical protein
MMKVIIIIIIFLSTFLLAFSVYMLIKDLLSKKDYYKNTQKYIS